MKKVLAAILSLFYLVTANGIAMNLHYCCGKLDNVVFSYATGTAVDSVPGALQTTYTGNDCCRDVSNQLKITQSENTTSSTVFFGGHSVAAVLSYIQPIITLSFSSVTKGNFSPHAPPFRETNPVYLKNCSFLI